VQSVYIGRVPIPRHIAQPPGEVATPHHCRKGLRGYIPRAIPVDPPPLIRVTKRHEVQHTVQAYPDPFESGVPAMSAARLSSKSDGKHTWMWTPANVSHLVRRKRGGTGIYGGTQRRELNKLRPTRTCTRRTLRRPEPKGCHRRRRSARLGAR
jgi:hypothetical protein